MQTNNQSEKYTTIHYHHYLGLDKILNSQELRSQTIGKKTAHDEMLFIITHQVYELWFKQIIHDMTSIHQLLNQEIVKEPNIGIAVHRLERIIKILKVAIQQIEVLETMSPLDFLDFRDYLFPASGFQSFQFRQVEAMLGLHNIGRTTYGGHHYASFFNEEQKQILQQLELQNSMLKVIEYWLERTPFVKYKDFDFLQSYEKSVEKMIANEQNSINQSLFLSEKEKEIRLKMLGDSSTYFASVFDKEHHEKLRKEGVITFSYQATLGALFISLYRDEPLLRMPYNLLNALMDVDELFTTWRFRHAQMVMRMIGKKIGTGGSSGHDYLLETTLKHQIFKDLYNISTLMIPRSELLPLPENIKADLDFHFNQK